MTPAALARPAAVFLLAAAALAYEILLLRVFAIEQFYHFAYMAIGVAMLGFGASGTLLALWSPRTTEQRETWFRRATVATGVALLAAPLAADVVPFDATQLAVDPGQWPRLAVLYVLLALPFACGALAVLLAILLGADRPGLTYGASFAGSGLGALAALGALWILDPVHALAVPAGIAAVAALPASPRAAAALMIAAGAAAIRPPWSLDITPYKGLPQVAAYPDARRTARATSPVGWVVAIEASAFRHAPGLSLAYTGSFPRQTALFVDGELTGALTAWTDTGSAAFLEWLPSAAPFATGQRSRVLVIGAGGGTDVSLALAHGTDEVTAVELHPALIRLQRTAAYPAAWAAERRVTWVAGDARSHVAHTRTHYDVITIGPGGGFGVASAGVHSLNEDYLHTTDAYAAYLARLAPGGVLAVTRWLALPPRANARVVLTAIEALRRVSPDHVADGVVVLRSWGTATTLVKPSGFTDAEIATLQRWADARRFDIDWRPGLDAPLTRYNRVADPVLFRAAKAGVRSQEAVAAFLAEYPFVVAPVSDARPYPHHFLDARGVRRLLAAERGGWLPFAEWGYLTLLATLAQAAALAGICLIVPVAVRTRLAWRPGLSRILLYFGAIGFAYLAAEIAAIQQFALWLGHPVYAVAAVLAVMLVCSGIGSLWSDRVTVRRDALVAAGIAAVLAASGLLLLDITHAVQAAPLSVRALLAVVMLGPVAILMGTPFPLGLRALAGGDGTKIAWAWAMNGFASVIAAPLSALIALELGTRVLFGTAAGAYIVAALAVYRLPPTADQLTT